jgi:hypothetical protein
MRNLLQRIRDSHVNSYEMGRIPQRNRARSQNARNAGTFIRPRDDSRCAIDHVQVDAELAFEHDLRVGWHLDMTVSQGTSETRSPARPPASSNSSVPDGAMCAAAIMIEGCVPIATAKGSGRFSRSARVEQLEVTRPHHVVAGLALGAQHRLRKSRKRAGMRLTLPYPRDAPCRCETATRSECRIATPDLNSPRA